MIRFEAARRCRRGLSGIFATAGPKDGPPHLPHAGQTLGIPQGMMAEFGRGPSGLNRRPPLLLPMPMVASSASARRRRPITCALRLATQNSDTGRTGVKVLDRWSADQGADPGSAADHRKQLTAAPVKGIQLLRFLQRVSIPGSQVTAYHSGTHLPHATRAYGAAKPIRPVPLQAAQGPNMYAPLV
jgi:hypothetical protein